MLRTLFLPLLVIFTLNLFGCGNLKLHIGISDPTTNSFKESYRGATEPSIPYSETEGWFVYPPASEQAIFNYCAAKNQAQTQPPVFDACKSNLDLFEFDCQSYTCSIIPAGGGVSCVSRAGYSVPWANSGNFVGLNSADNTTYLDFCNITF